MRKVDYILLAELIASGLKIADDMAREGSTLHAAGQRCALESLAHTAGQRCALENLAHAFARSASVDRAAFLKACGIIDTP